MYVTKRGSAFRAYVNIASVSALFVVGVFVLLLNLEYLWRGGLSGVSASFLCAIALTGVVVRWWHYTAEVFYGWGRQANIFWVVYMFVALGSIQLGHLLEEFWGGATLYAVLFAVHFVVMIIALSLFLRRP